MVSETKFNEMLEQLSLSQADYDFYGKVSQYLAHTMVKDKSRSQIGSLLTKMIGDMKAPLVTSLLLTALSTPFQDDVSETDALERALAMVIFSVLSTGQQGVRDENLYSALKDVADSYRETFDRVEREKAKIAVMATNAVH